METKYLPLEWKATPEGVVEGYASLFGEADQGGDVVMAGAYSQSLRAMKADGRKVKMLWQHDPSHPIGVWDEVQEDSKGLWVKGRILSEVEKGREAIALIGNKSIDGLSIGYKTKQSDRDSKGNRRLLEVELWEVSLVTFPMLQSAKIMAMKSVDDLREGNAAPLKRAVEEFLREAGYSNTEAKAGASALASKIGAMREAGANLDELAALLRARLPQK